MRRINEFYDGIEALNKSLKKRKRYIRDENLKKELKTFYINWKKEISSKVNSVQNSKETVKKLDSLITSVYKLSSKNYFENKILKKYLKDIMEILFEEVILIMETQKEVIEIPHSLYEYIKDIKIEHEKEFAEESISCLSIEKTRPAIIMAWVLVMYNIYNKIHGKGFGLFNREYEKRYGSRNPKFKRVKKIDDFEYFPDQEVILISEDLAIFDRNERRILIDDCLKLRNMCSHPGKYNPGKKDTEVFFEKIVKIVLSK